jgi:hypothetical protein
MMLFVVTACSVTFEDSNVWSLARVGQIFLIWILRVLPYCELFHRASQHHVSSENHTTQSVLKLTQSMFQWYPASGNDFIAY